MNANYSIRIISVKHDNFACSSSLLFLKLKLPFIPSSLFFTWNLLRFVIRHFIFKCIIIIFEIFIIWRITILFFLYFRYFFFLSRFFYNNAFRTAFRRCWYFLTAWFFRSSYWYRFTLGFRWLWLRARILMNWNLLFLVWAYIFIWLINFTFLIWRRL